ncbi:MAG TPA: hypothetical protein VJ949_08245, partial [Cryomorphaceae bacterium]|nr:hypothetical protein [Cryomorphaceae bacterium]
MDQSIVKEVEKFATNKLTTELPDYAKYHDLEHTRTVVREVRLLAAEEEVNPNQTNCLEVAA